MSLLSDTSILVLFVSVFSASGTTFWPVTWPVIGNFWLPVTPVARPELEATAAASAALSIAASLSLGSPQKGLLQFATA